MQDVSDTTCCNEATMPSTDQRQESHSGQSLISTTSLSKVWPVVQVLSEAVLYGAEYIYRCLVGLETHEAALDEGRQSIGENLESCIEEEVEASFIRLQRVVDVGWEVQPQEGDTELRALSDSVRPHLPDNESDEFKSIKLNAVRQAFEIIVADPECRRFLKESGFSLLSGLLTLAGKRSVGFGLMWEQLMTFLENPSNWRAIAEECQEAGVSRCCSRAQRRPCLSINHSVAWFSLNEPIMSAQPEEVLRKIRLLDLREKPGKTSTGLDLIDVQMQRACFYDIFYESIVLKLLECRQHIPATLKPTLHTHWISPSMKKTTVMFYAWSQIKKKRLCMTRERGLYHHLYEVFDYVDPEIMWAAFGLQSKAKDYYLLLKSQVLSFIRHIFSLQRSWYDSPANLKTLIYSAWQDLVWRLQSYLEENINQKTIQD